MQQEILNDLHKTELEILDEVKRICDKKGISFFLIGGSLIGAIRHKGFIPWDDDIDIAMVREEYDRFLEIAPYELNDNFFLQTYLNDPTYPKGFAKIRKKNTWFVDEAIKNVDTSHQIYIDIFPYDSVSSNSIISKIKIRIMMNLDFYLSNKRYHRKKTKLREYLLSLIPEQKLVQFQEWIAHGNGKSFTNYYTAYSPFDEIIDKDKILPLIQVEFEGRKLNAPKEYDFYLTKIYGDYMKLPPVEKRKTHNPVKLSFDTNGPDEILEEKK